MARTLRTIRRTYAAALHTGQHMVAATISTHHRLLVRLLTAADTGATVRIRYQDQHGAISVRDISPHTLRATNTGFITVRAFDWRDQEDTTFRTDRITINPQENPMADTGTSTTVIGPYTITLRPAAPGPLGFTHETTVWAKATEDDALAFDMDEGAPILTDEAGAYDLAQGRRDFNAFVALYGSRVETAAA